MVESRFATLRNLRQWARVSATRATRWCRRLRWGEGQRIEEGRKEIRDMVMNMAETHTPRPLYKQEKMEGGTAEAKGGWARAYLVRYRVNSGSYMPAGR